MEKIKILYLLGFVSFIVGVVGLIFPITSVRYIYTIETILKENDIEFGSPFMGYPGDIIKISLVSSPDSIKVLILKFEAQKWVFIVNGSEIEKEFVVFSKGFYVPVLAGKSVELRDGEYMSVSMVGERPKSLVYGEVKVIRSMSVMQLFEEHWPFDIVFRVLVISVSALSIGAGYIALSFLLRRTEEK